MRCINCDKVLKVGDRYIEDTPSGFLNEDSPAEIDSIISSVFGGTDGKIYYCENCTVPGGDYMFSTVYGDEDDED